LPLETRRELLADALAKVDYPVLRSTAFDAKPADLIRAAKELELEGVIAKRRAHRTNPVAERRLAEI
jgi:ATP-dependent DNA ligase